MNKILKRVFVLGVCAMTLVANFLPIFRNDTALATGEPIVNVTGLADEDGRIEVRNSATVADKVDVTFETLWHMKFVGNVTVNGQSVPVSNYIDYDDQASYLAHYNSQIVSFSAQFDRAANDTYDVVVTTARNNKQHVGNFLWTADPAQKWERRCDDATGEVICEYVLDENGNKVPGRNYIGNSRIALVAVEYTVGGTTYKCNFEKEDCTGLPYLEFDSGNKEYDDGSLVIPAGARITMRIIPDYGYQVLNVNMSELTTSDDGVGEFTFTVPGGAAYFVADVVKMDDAVNAKADGVSSGSIDLGSKQTTMSRGTARLDVEDVQLSSENVAKFENAAEGYKIKNYLDISLFNIVYKGSEDDAWEQQVRNLNEEAVITLQLEDGVDGNDIVIVHEKHDGTYEIIDTEYDPETHTISFKTSSFSNYAIASRTLKAPDTGIVK